MFVSPLCVTQWRSLPRREVGNLSSVSQRTSCLKISKIVRENFIESYFSARNLGLVMHLDCFKCNHHQWKLSNKLHEPNDFYCLKKYILKPFLLYPYFFPPTLRMTGPESLLSARMRNGDGGRSSSGSGTSPSLTASWHHHDHDNIQWIKSFVV